MTPLNGDKNTGKDTTRIALNTQKTIKLLKLPPPPSHAEPSQTRESTGTSGVASVPSHPASQDLASSLFWETQLFPPGEEAKAEPPCKPDKAGGQPCQAKQLGHKTKLQTT